MQITEKKRKRFQNSCMYFFWEIKDQNRILNFEQKKKAHK